MRPPVLSPDLYLRQWHFAQFDYTMATRIKQKEKKEKRKKKEKKKREKKTEKDKKKSKKDKRRE